MFLPIRDENPQLDTPWVTYAIIALNVLVWLLLQGAGQEPALTKSVCTFGVIPADLFGQLPETARVACPMDGQPDWHTLLTSMFMHGSWMHLLGNMWIFWIFGNNIEDSMGHWRFALFYLLCGLLADAAHIVVDPASISPTVGASGAIYGVLGAYLVLYPRVHVHMLVFWFTFAVPAVAVLLLWIAFDVFGGLSNLGIRGGGVAHWAHIGGFFAGMLTVFVFKDEALLARHPYRGWQQREHPDNRWKRVQGKRGSWH